MQGGTEASKVGKRIHMENRIGIATKANAITSGGSRDGKSLEWQWLCIHLSCTEYIHTCMHMPVHREPGIELRRITRIATPDALICG